MKKFLVIFFIFFLNSNLSGQDYSNSGIHQLSYRDSLNLLSLGLDINKTEYNNLKLRQLLLIDKRRKINNVIGSIFRVAGFINGGLGVIFLSTASAQNSGIGQGIAALIGASFISVGVIGYGISVPFKTAAKRRILERELMIQKLREKN